MVQKSQIIALHMREALFQNLFPAGKMGNQSKGMTFYKFIPSGILKRINYYGIWQMIIRM